MAAELPHDSDPNHKPAAPAAATSTGRVSRATVAMFVFLALNFALSLYRVQDDGRGAVAFVAGSHLNLALLVCALRHGEVAPLGSPARARAKVAVWVLTATLTASFTWKVGEVMPFGLAVAGWVMAAATLGGGFYVMFFLDGEKRSGESLIVRDCEKD